MTTFTLKQLQEEQIPWVWHNFRDRAAWHPLLGVGEELGELYAAQTFEDRTDAIADMTIFLSDYATAMAWQMATLWADAQVLAVQGPNRDVLVSAVGTLQHCHLKAVQGIRGSAAEHSEAGQGAASVILACLSSMAGPLYLRMVQKVWASVKVRDWKAYPTTGGLEPEARIEQVVTTMDAAPQPGE